MRSALRRRLLGVLVVATGALLVADLSGSPVADHVRGAGTAVFGPLQRALSVPTDDEVSGLRAENARLRAELLLREQEVSRTTDLQRLLGSDSAAKRRMVVARVVSSELSPLAGRGITLDVGARDGVLVDSTVLAADGLVGRIVSVGHWTSDVQVLGARGSVVGVRVGTAGTLATVSSGTAAGSIARPKGTLSLDLAGPDGPRVGDKVTTLGSVDGRPYVEGIPVGTVTAVDPDGGRPRHSATVTPSVHLDALDLVAVVLPAPREMPREVAR